MKTPLDLSKFKKMKTEKEHTVLQHPDGHEIRLLHNKLSPKIKEQLDKIPHHHQSNPKLQQSHVKDEAPKMMAEGGEAIKKENYSEGGLSNTASHFVRRATGNETPPPAPAPNESLEEKNARIREQNSKNMEPGGYKLAEGGKVDPYKQAGSDISKSIPADKAKAMAGAFSKGGGVHLHFYAEGSNGPVSSMDQSPADAFVQELGQNAPAPVQNSAPQPEQMVPQTAPEAPIAPPSPMAPPTGTLPEQAVANVEAQNKAEMAGAQNTKEALGQEANIEGQKAEQMQQLHQKYEQIGNDLHSKYDKLSEEVATTKIDPNHWFKSQSTGSQILTSIGMLFAGAAMGISGHPEMAQKSIDNVIDRDIDAQKTDLHNKNTLLGKYMEMYNSLPQAEAAARLTMEAGVEGLIKQQAAKLGSQNAMLQAQQTIAARRQALLPQMESLAKGQAMMGMYNEMGKSQGQSSSQEQSYQNQMQRMRVLNPDLGKDMQDKYLPGVGISRVPVPEKIRDKLIASHDVSQQLAQLENFARENSGSLNPETIRRGKVLAAAATNAVRTATDQGVFKPSDQHFLESMVDPDPTKFLANIRTIPKYNQLRKINDNSMNQIYKGYGVKPFQDSGEQVQTMNGVQYRKVPGGWKKVD